MVVIIPVSMMVIWLGCSPACPVTAGDHFKVPATWGPAGKAPCAKWDEVVATATAPAVRT